MVRKTKILWHSTRYSSTEGFMGAKRVLVQQCKEKEEDDRWQRIQQFYGAVLDSTTKDSMGMKLTH